MGGFLSKPDPRRAAAWLTPWREELEDLVSRFRGDESDNWFLRGGMTSLDIAETDQAIEVRMDLPGVKPDEVDIQLSGNSLTIGGQRKEEEETEDKKRNYHRVERRYGSFSRSVTLPCAVREDDAVAEFKDGVLTIVLPKTEEAKTKKIQVNG